jgi:hypothetical protein
MDTAAEMYELSKRYPLGLGGKIIRWVNVKLENINQT